MRRIGVLMSNVESDPFGQTLVAAFQGALSKLGWTEGSDLRIELRWGAADADKIRTLAKELVDLRVDGCRYLRSRPYRSLRMREK
jgi:putative tryptophan/tyrosine transport system substrate-binding protein